MLIGLIVFAVMPFTYLLVKDYSLLIIIRFIHGLATAIYGLCPWQLWQTWLEPEKENAVMVFVSHES